MSKVDAARGAEQGRMTWCSVGMIPRLVDAFLRNEFYHNGLQAVDRLTQCCTWQRQRVAGTITLPQTTQHDIELVHRQTS